MATGPGAARARDEGCDSEEGRGRHFFLIQVAQDAFAFPSPPPAAPEVDFDLGSFSLKRNEEARGGGRRVSTLPLIISWPPARAIFP